MQLSKLLKKYKFIIYYTLKENWGVDILKKITII